HATGRQDLNRANFGIQTHNPSEADSESSIRNGNVSRFDEGGISASSGKNVQFGKNHVALHADVENASSNFLRPRSRFIEIKVQLILPEGRGKQGSRLHFECQVRRFVAWQQLFEGTELGQLKRQVFMWPEGCCPVPNQRKLARTFLDCQRKTL